MTRLRLLAAAALILFCCGGDDKTPPDSAVLMWDQAPTFSDNSAMPVEHVARFDIYVSPDNVFTDNCLAAAAAGTYLDNGALVFTDRFDLALLAPFGYRSGFVSVRSVGIDNAESEFSAPAIWD